MPTDNLQAKAHRAARTVLHYAKRDTDAVSVLSDGTCEADTDAAVFVVKGRDNVAYLRGLCERQGLLTAGKPVADQKTPNVGVQRRPAHDGRDPQDGLGPSAATTGSASGAEAKGR